MLLKKPGTSTAALTLINASSKPIENIFASVVLLFVCLTMLLVVFFSSLFSLELNDDFISKFGSVFICFFYVLLSLMLLLFSFSLNSRFF